MDYLDYQLAAAEDSYFAEFERQQCWPHHKGIDPGCSLCDHQETCKGIEKLEGEGNNENS
jgi:hypothetical protein